MRYLFLFAWLFSFAQPGQSETRAVAGGLTFDLSGEFERMIEFDDEPIPSNVAMFVRLLSPETVSERLETSFDNEFWVGDDARVQFISVVHQLELTQEDLVHLPDAAPSNELIQLLEQSKMPSARSWFNLISELNYEFFGPQYMASYFDASRNYGLIVTPQLFSSLHFFEVDGRPVLISCTNVLEAEIAWELARDENGNVDLSAYQRADIDSAFSSMAMSNLVSGIIESAKWRE